MWSNSISGTIHIYLFLKFVWNTVYLAQLHMKWWDLEMRAATPRNKQTSNQESECMSQQVCSVPFFFFRNRILKQSNPIFYFFSFSGSLALSGIHLLNTSSCNYSKLISLISKQMLFFSFSFYLGVSLCSFVANANSSNITNLFILLVLKGQWSTLLLLFYTVSYNMFILIAQNLAFKTTLRPLKGFQYTRLLAMDWACF